MEVTLEPGSKSLLTRSQRSLLLGDGEKSFDMSSIVENIFVEEEECAATIPVDEVIIRDSPRAAAAKLPQEKKKVSWGDEGEMAGLAEWRIFRASQSPVAVGMTQPALSTVKQAGVCIFIEASRPHPGHPYWD
jgi:hypothetical protein